MSVRMRHTRGHTGNRRSHHALKNTNIVTDKESGNLRLPHRIDEATGMYRGKQIAPAKAARPAKSKVKGPSVEVAHDHKHDHAHEAHENAEVKAAENVSVKSEKGGGRKKTPKSSKNAD